MCEKKGFQMFPNPALLLKNKKDDKYIVFFNDLNYTPLSKILILTSTTSSLTAS